MREHINGRLTHGDIRDGKVFWGFNCGVEEWCTPEALRDGRKKRTVVLSGLRGDADTGWVNTKKPSPVRHVSKSMVSGFATRQSS